MVERSLSMREVPGSIPGISKIFHFPIEELNSRGTNGVLNAILPFWAKMKSLEMPGIDPGTSRMLSERSTI